MSEKTELTATGAISNPHPEFGVFAHEGFMVVRMFAPLNEKSTAALSKIVEEMQNTKPQHMVFDCLDMNDLPMHWARFVVAASRALAKIQLKVVGLNCNDRLRRFLTQEGLDSSLPVAASWPEAMAKLGVQKNVQTLDVKLINPFLGAAANMIATQMSTACTSGSVTTIKPNTAFSGDISGLITLDCKSLRAVVVLTFPKETIFKLVGKITGTAPTEVNSMVKGSVGEITNVAFTRGKKTLNEMGYGIKSAVPTVVEVAELPAEYWQFNGAGVVIPFNTDCGVYFAEIRLAA